MKTWKIMAVALCAASAAQASLISGVSAQNFGNATTNINLDVVGAVDWSIWSNEDVAGRQKTGGTVIGDYSVVLPVDPTLALGTSDTLSGLTYTSTGPVNNALNSTERRISDTNGGMESNGSSISITVGGGSGLVTVYGYTLRTGMQITASLAGHTNVVTQVANNGTIQNLLIYQVAFDADNVTDLLTLKFEGFNSLNNGVVDRLGVAAMAVNVIPEPATMGMITAGALMLLGVRRIMM